MECSSTKQVSLLEGRSRFRFLSPVIIIFFSVQNSLEQALDSPVPSSWDKLLTAELLGHSPSCSDSRKVQLLQVKRNKNSMEVQLAIMWGWMGGRHKAEEIGRGVLKQQFPAGHN